MTSNLKKCIHVLATAGYAPELCGITIPRLRAYASRIGADFNLIQERKFPDYPINYERMQVYDAGKGYDWNINIDADMVVGSQLRDVTDTTPKGQVSIAMKYDLSTHFHTMGNIFFERDGRDVGLVDAFVVTSALTHDLWKPLPGDFVSHKRLFKDTEYRRISEYCLSLNLATYGLHYGGAFVRTDPIFHVGFTSGSVEDAANIARAKLREWGEDV
ncbi:MAG: hypothetical protein RL326_764 [Pseudomonadota bacterium]